MMKKTLKSIPPILFWLVLWQLISVIIHNRILMAGPVETLLTLAHMAVTGAFWTSVLSSVLKILSGFLVGAVLGILLSFLSYKKAPAKEIIRVPVAVLKSVPVASFIILLLIWFGSANISIFISAMVVFPIVYLSTLEGFEATDVKLLEMAQTFRMPQANVIRYIFIPQLMPFLCSSLSLSIGMAFKSGIAAEVIGQPLFTIGNGLYNAKIYLETGELFAWTVTVVLISFICEKILLLILKLLGGRSA